MIAIGYTLNRQEFMSNADPRMIALARDAAARCNLDAAIVCAVIEQESGWDSHAMRYEGAFRAKYVAPLGLSPTEEIARSISWGLMQVMGQVAREQGFAGKFLSELCEPDTGVALGCAVLAGKLAVAEGELGSMARASDPGGAHCLAACKTATLGCVSIGPPGAAGSGIPPAPSDDAARVGDVYWRALMLWNGGANPLYADQVLHRVCAYR
jgi:hypothetical protein